MITFVYENSLTNIYILYRNHLGMQNIDVRNGINYRQQEK